MIEVGYADLPGAHPVYQVLTDAFREIAPILDEFYQYPISAELAGLRQSSNFYGDVCRLTNALPHHLGCRSHSTISHPIGAREGTGSAIALMAFCVCGLARAWLVSLGPRMDR